MRQPCAGVQLCAGGVLPSMQQDAAQRLGGLLYTDSPTQAVINP
jgi:hypothetical protein